MIETIPNFSTLVKNSINGTPVTIGDKIYSSGYRIGIAFKGKNVKVKYEII